MIEEKDRLAAIIRSENVSAKQFAEEVGIQPGTVSNILSGRNKPSLEVMQKVQKRYQHISLDWLICGEGPMYREKSDFQPSLPFEQNNCTDDDNRRRQPNLFAKTENETSSRNIPLTTVPTIQVGNSNGQTAAMQIATKQQEIKNKNVQKIVIFYDDGTFEEFMH